MTMKDISVRGNNGEVIVENVVDFNMDHIFDCGQCFRWEKKAGGGYTGVAFGKIAHMEYDGHSETLRIFNSDIEDFNRVWRKYLDLDRDYGSIKEYLIDNDETIKAAVDYGYGIRILNQEKWETLISFIISQNNNIPRIKKCIDVLAETLGEKSGTYEGKDYYSLPSPERLAEATPEDLAICRLGYRTKYLIETAKAVSVQGLESLEKLASSEITSAQTVEALRQYCGVGPKVANCIALFSMGRIDSFPIDVWVKKVMNRLYGFDEGDMKGMAEFAADRFGNYGGIAQQYLFYYITHSTDEL